MFGLLVLYLKGIFLDPHGMLAGIKHHAISLAFFGVIALWVWLSILKDKWHDRCPKCWKWGMRASRGREFLDAKEFYETLDRVDHGELDGKAFHVNRKEQVHMVQEHIRDHYICNNDTCAHKWFQDWVNQYEGSIPR